MTMPWTWMDAHRLHKSIGRASYNAYAIWRPSRYVSRTPRTRSAIQFMRYACACLAYAAIFIHCPMVSTARFLCRTWFYYSLLAHNSRLHNVHQHYTHAL